jgi:ABC-type nitrate/sulfonate/bicarbonate transport system substrate-binding protein
MLRKLTVIISLVFILFVTLPLAGCRAPQKTADQVTLQLNWVHSAEFIGYYMADAKEFYREANINAKISEGGPGIVARDMILNGKADFAIASFDEQKNFIEANKPSVAVMSVFQVPPQVMFSLTESNIKEPKDLIGKRIGIKNDYWREIERKTLANAGIDPSKVTEVKVSSDAQNMLYDHEVDVWMGYANDEPISAQVAGYSVTNLYPADYGVGGYEGLLLVNEDTIGQKADMVGRFVQASTKGLIYALEHPDEAAQVMTQWQSQEPLNYYKLAIRAMIPLVDIPQSKVGWIDGKRWEQLMGRSYDALSPGYNMQFLQAK